MINILHTKLMDANVTIITIILLIILLIIAVCAAYAVVKKRISESTATYVFVALIVVAILILILFAIMTQQWLKYSISRKPMERYIQEYGSKQKVSGEVYAFISGESAARSINNTTKSILNQTKRVDKIYVSIPTSSPVPKEISNNPWVEVIRYNNKCGDIAAVMEKHKDHPNSVIVSTASGAFYDPTVIEKLEGYSCTSCLQPTVMIPKFI